MTQGARGRSAQIYDAEQHTPSALAATLTALLSKEAALPITLGFAILWWAARSNVGRTKIAHDGNPSESGKQRTVANLHRAAVVGIV